jgi:hypothetical protein
MPGVDDEFPTGFYPPLDLAGSDWDELQSARILDLWV